MLRRDHKVPFATDASIALIADRIRLAAGMDRTTLLDVVRLLNKLRGVALPNKGSLRVIPLLEGEPVPYVTYSPLLLHIHDETITHAKLGDEESRFVIAHEIGHIVLHDHYAQPFSYDPLLQATFVQNEESAEWQANRFAYHLLVPNRLIHHFDFDQATIGRCCGVSEKVARELVSEALAKHKRTFSGETCPKCGCFVSEYTPRLTSCARCTP